MRGKTTHVDISDAIFNQISRVIAFQDTVFVASKEGLTIIPQQYFCERQTVPPIPFFKSVKVNDKEIQWPKAEIQLKGRSKISFNLGAISFSDHLITFAYSMGNGDTSWTQASTSEIVFQDLAPGKYTFRLKVKKLNSGWSKPIQCSVEIRPTLWQHPLFRALLIVLFTGIVVLFVIRRKNQQLRKTINRMMPALSFQNLPG
jgi:hypothetical protein